MKYIRTKEGVYEINRYYDPRDYYWVKQNCEQPIGSDEILEQADTIEELCDEFVGIRKSNHKAYTGRLDGAYWFKETNGWLGRLDSYEIIYGAIWTSKGLIYVAKMNEKGELELL